MCVRILIEIGIIFPLFTSGLNYGVYIVLYYIIYIEFKL